MPVRIDWSYQRPGCFQCQRAQAYLADVDVCIVAEQCAKSQTVLREEALGMLRGATELHSARGKNITHFDLRQDMPSEPTLEKLFLRPDGDLRAPALRIGTVMVVGFHPDLYGQLFPRPDE